MRFRTTSIPARFGARFSVRLLESGAVEVGIHGDGKAMFCVLDQAGREQAWWRLRRPDSREA